jgi:hypothetical protein
MVPVLAKQLRNSLWSFFTWLLGRISVFLYRGALPDGASRERRREEALHPAIS